MNSSAGYPPLPNQPAAYLPEPPVYAASGLTPFVLSTVKRAGCVNGFSILLILLALLNMLAGSFISIIGVFIPAVVIQGARRGKPAYLKSAMFGIMLLLVLSTIAAITVEAGELDSGSMRAVSKEQFWAMYAVSVVIWLVYLYFVNSLWTKLNDLTPEEQFEYQMRVGYCCW